MVTCNTNDFQVIDFFCGCGGTSAGLRKAGMNILAGIDIDHKALDTYATNFPESVTVERSVVDLKTDELQSLTQIKQGKPLLFAVCAPCQPFSTQNRLKTTSDKRISLLEELHRFVIKYKPDYLVLENVPGIQKVEEGPFTRFLALLKKLDYHFDYNVLNAVNYGVPQSRKRLVLVASIHGEIKLPKPTHGKGLEKHLTVRETIKKYPVLRAGGSSEKYPNHRCAGMSELTLERLSHTPEGGDRRDWPDNLILECHKTHKGHNDVYGRLSWKKPSVTLTTKCTSISNGRFGHPSQKRALSVREAAALQSFPDDFVFKGSLQDTARQVGNAVPVDFSAALGEEIINHHTSRLYGKV